METKANQNQIVITTKPENEKQKLPMNLVLSLAAGTIAGVALIFGLFWGVEMLFSLWFQKLQNPKNKIIKIKLA